MIKIIKYSTIFIIVSIISSLFVFYFYLLKGINIQHLDYKFINIGKLYIKIDKKIIFQAENIKINKKNDKKNINFSETTKLIKNILKYLNYFQEIKINNLIINQNKIKNLSLYKNRFIVDTDKILLEASLTPKNNKIYFKIFNLKIKKLNLEFNNIEGNFYSDLLHLYIKLHTVHNGTEISSKIKISNKKIYYQGKIDNITKNTIIPFDKNLKIIKKLHIYSVIFKGTEKNTKIKIKETKILLPQKSLVFIPNLDILFDIKHNLLKINNKISKIKFQNKIFTFNNTKIDYYINDNLIKIANEKIKTNIDKIMIDISDNSIKYNSTNTIIHSEALKIYNDNFHSIINDFNVIYNNHNLIKISTPVVVFQNNRLNGNIDKTGVEVNLTSKIVNFYNKKININYKKLPTLKVSNMKGFYDINKSTLFSSIPMIKLKQIEINNTKVNLKNNLLKINFNNKNILSKQVTKMLSKIDINIPIYQKNGKNEINGTISYDLNKSKLHTNIKIDINNSNLFLTKGVDLHIKYAHLLLKESNLSLFNSFVEFNKSIINSSYNLKTGLINLNKMKIDINGSFQTLNIDNIIKLKNYPEKIKIDLKKMDINLPNLATSIKIKKELNIYINKISKLYPYINYLQKYGIKDGKISININKDQIKIYSFISDTNQSILEKNLNPIKKIEINTTIKNNNISINNKNLHLQIIQTNPTIKIDGKFKNLDFNLTSIINDLTQNKIKTENNNSSSINKKFELNISGYKNYIIYNENKLYSDKLFINYKNDKGKIVSLYKDRNISIYYNQGNIKIYGLNIREKTFKEITNTNILKDPLLNIFAIQNKNTDTLQGFIDIRRGYIKELKAFTNVLAFINLIPSLVTFQAVGFSTKGYKIKKGYIEFILHNNILYLKKIQIKGINLTFNGNGYINLKKKTIHLNVNVNLLIKLIKDIPIVNYILLGKDGGITIKLTISGPLDNPKVHKNTLSNIIDGPLDILKRVILTPFRPFIKEEQK